MEKICGIYCITNITNNKRYIGQSVDIKCRWRNHKYKLRNNKHKNIYLQNAWNKYGENNFVWEVLEQCNLTLLDERESYYILKYHSIDREYGYNHESGGHTNKQLSQEHKQRLSEAHKGKILSEEHKHNISEGGKGHVCTQETKQKIRDKITGIKRSDETCKLISEGRMGKNNWRCREVYCIELNEVFYGAIEAERKYNISASSICRHLKGYTQSAGVHPTSNKPLHWVYTDSIFVDYTIQND